MKISTLKSTAMAVALLASVSASAQNYIQAAPQGGFNFNKTKDFVVLYAPSDVVTKMGSKIKSNQNLDPDQVKNQFQYWVTDWDKSMLTVYNYEETNPKNSTGGTEYQNLVPLYAWGAGQFAALSTPYDLSMLDDSYILHLGLRDFGTKPSKMKIQVLPSQPLGYKLETGLAVGDADGDYAGIGNLPQDSKWYYVDIPLKDLNDANGNYGFDPDFTKPIKDNVFTIGFGSCTVANYKFGSIPPGEQLKTVNITKVNSAISIEGVWFYKNIPAGIDGVEVAPEEKADNAIYNLAGQRVGNDYKGIVIKNGKKYINR